MNPTVTIDHPTMLANVATVQAAATAAGRRVRAHVKGHRTTEISAVQMASGACGLLAQTTLEAAAHMTSGARDIVLARNHVDSWRWPVFARFAAEAKESGCRVIVHAPDAAAVTELGFAAAAMGTVVDVRLEVALEGGRGTSPPDIPALAELVTRTNGLSLEGITGYVAPTRRTMLEEWDSISESEVTRLVAAGNDIRQRGIALSTIAVSGAANLQSGLTVVGVTEVCLGAYALWDAGSVTQGLCDYRDVAISLCAVVTGVDEVVRTSADHLIRRATHEWDPEICAVLSDGTPLSQAGLTVGDNVTLLPAHICPLALGVEEFHVTGTREDQWRTVLLPEPQPG